ncbi:MAG: T9SS type A sorting domain-containing protein [Candidatus Krumholzibacteria bacterium]|nr:T9SS type A sorting domain-containing protein [Candidatus Krumholzibacteria bacterium]MDH4338176.1 T9SS type A sorting domain-containing protein [Candidatus Krumholzibacteria bacterium]MDH5269835.1 T9SS type A sorting domain-containing protein [Candidatus Krumholzibacteria bacterium]
MHRTLSVGLLPAALAAFSIASAPDPANAGWYPGVAYVAGNGIDNIQNFKVLPDGAGGMFVVWQDSSATTGYDIWAARLNRYGDYLVYQPVCNDGGNQTFPDACIDPATGGLYIAWEDDRYGGTDIWALHMLSDGQVVGWNPGGQPVCSEAGNQGQAKIAPDGTGGAILAWEDLRSGLSVDIYALRVDSAGDPIWTPNGIPVCTSVKSQTNIEMVADGQGGAVLVWQDYRFTTTGPDIYGQLLDPNGYGLWTPGGTVISAEANAQLNPRLVADGAGGAIFTWEDYRYGNSYVFVQRVDFKGDAAWTPGGVLVTTYGYEGGSPSIATDGQGGAVIAYREESFYSSYGTDIVAAHILASGTADYLFDIWICSATGDQAFPSIAYAGADGWVVAWQDMRSGNWDVYAQRIGADGRQVWAPDGVPMLATTYPEQSVAVVAGNAGAALGAWLFENSPNDNDLYATRLNGDDGAWGHPEPTLLSAADTPSDQGGHVMLTWKASERDTRTMQEITHYTIWREAGVVAADSPELAAPGAFIDPATMVSDFTGTARRIVVSAAGATTWEYVATVPIRYATQYNFNTPTLSDSVGGDPADETYQVLSHAGTFLFWQSEVMNAHSVDNLAPAAPLMLSAQRVGNDVQLSWSPSGANENDLRDYAIYRAGAPGVTPEPSLLAGSAGQAGFLDVAPGAGPLYYIVTAVDVHENQSTPSNEAQILAPTGIGNTPSIPAALTLMPNAPNPFGASTRFRVGSPEAGMARAELYDVAGRRVWSGEIPLQAGWRDVVFDARDAHGQPLASGVYFYRIHLRGETRTHKMVIAR